VKQVRFSHWTVLLLTLACHSLVRRADAEDGFPTPFNSPSEAGLSPLPPEAAAKGFSVPAGFRVSVFAAEPDVQNPIAVAWDSRGRMWVAENFTYSDRQQRFDLSLRDRVLILHDADRDGVAEERKVFLDTVQMLTSVEVGRGGVWLMCPPRLLFVPDQDQDDRPDGPPQVVLDGFHVAQDNYHNFANGLRWGPDGWLYGRCGHSCPGLLGIPGTPDEQRVPIDGGIWRFHPERKVVEVLCYGTVNPWGHDWDSQGELFFINTVIGHVWHLMPGAHFQESFGQSLNPYVYERIDMIADHYHFDTQAGWTASRDGAANDHGGGHAHIGMLIYQGRTWPETFHGRLLTLNMHGRRTNVERLEQSGAGYVARHEEDHFFAADPFFRGLELTMGPDGNVYMVDWSDTGECHEHTGVHRTSGRIFKFCYGPPVADAEFAKPMCLAGSGRLPELWRAYQAGMTTDDSLRALLTDPDLHLRVWAIRLLTDSWPLDSVVGPLPGVVYPDSPKTVEAFVRLAREDQTGLVQLALASTLQRLPVDARPPLARELIRHAEYANDRDLPLLVWYGLIPVGQRDPHNLADLIQASSWPRLTNWISRFVSSQIESQPEALEQILAWAVEQSPEQQVAVLTGMHAAFQGWRQAVPPPSWPKFASSGALRSHQEAIDQLNQLFGSGRSPEELRAVALDGEVDMKTRQAALAAYIDIQPTDLRTVCEQLLSVRDLNLVAARGLSLLDDPSVGRLLATNYRRFQPADRPALLSILASRPTFASALLDQLDSDQGSISRADLSPILARQIRNLNDEGLSRRLSELWGELRETADEKKHEMNVFREMLKPEAISQADRDAGRKLFATRCGSCHLLFGEGQKIGPDLTGAQRTSVEYLLENIVDPSAVVSREYRQTLITTVDGRVLSGLVLSRNEKSITLQTPTEQLQVRLEDIESEQLTSQSSMPEGLLNQLSMPELLNLFAHLTAPTP
jgi:putative membrane-bound dehydrogenase-like protein